MKTKTTKDINNTKEFHEWIRKTFEWVDSDVKKYMYRSWCARRKYLIKND